MYNMSLNFNYDYNDDQNKHSFSGSLTDSNGFNAHTKASSSQIDMALKAFGDNFIKEVQKSVDQYTHDSDKDLEKISEQLDKCVDPEVMKKDLKAILTDKMNESPAVKQAMNQKQNQNRNRYQIGCSPKPNTAKRPNQASCRQGNMPEAYKATLDSLKELNEKIDNMQTRIEKMEKQNKAKEQPAGCNRPKNLRDDFWWDSFPFF